jgi:hypothetical protein
MLAASDVEFVVVDVAVDEVKVAFAETMSVDEADTEVVEKAAQYDRLKLALTGMSSVEFCRLASRLRRRSRLRLVPRSCPQSLWKALLYATIMEFAGGAT